MSTITYLIIGNYDNYQIGSGGGYVHDQLYQEECYAITKAELAIKAYNLDDVEVLKMNTSNGAITTVWEQNT